ncbi:DUF4355 domain-containing protein [Marinilactibacillus psychrotolerans]|uniref:DUF4355 domain-containing protein n=1 Tax=Marinilactibacillus psychrotolerans TaxID=191770 RepID=A0A5R9C066_9LACT|nr:DUF4355 domain-containing protein [Marinilactibacillus psychrotolerans]TLQ06057.1 DUF4355 domain-containing protein [Marinilactibacillus psychrotolerans]
MKEKILSNLDSANSLKMKLQFFADPDGGDDNANPDGDDKGSENGGDGGSEVELPKTQAELDAAINKANHKAIKNATKGLLTEEQANERIQVALKKEKDYSSLSDDERKQREWEDQKNQFEKEKADFERQKLETQIEKDMIRKGLPVLAGEGDDEFSFATLFAQSGDSEQALKAVGAYEKAFKEAVAAEVKESLKQSAPGAGGGNGTATQNYGERVGKRKQKQNGPIFGN